MDPGLLLLKWAKSVKAYRRDLIWRLFTQRAETPPLQQGPGAEMLGCGSLADLRWITVFRWGFWHSALFLSFSHAPHVQLLRAVKPFDLMREAEHLWIGLIIKRIFFFHLVICSLLFCTLHLHLGHLADVFIWSDLYICQKKNSNISLSVQSGCS